MCTRAQCERHIGQWVQFRTSYGMHRGIIERVTSHSAIVVSPRQFVPAQLVSHEIGESDERKLDLALAQWGGYGGYPAGGYGGFGFGWRRWAVSFLVIYALWGLLW